MGKRLQIKGKYHVLTPIMKKMNEASQEQKKHEIRIKHLLNQLKEARNQCQKSQQSFNVLLKQFFKKKEEIDKRIINKKLIAQVPVTSTPKCAKLENNKTTLTSRVPMTSYVKSCSSSLPQEKLECKVVLEKCPDNLTDPNDIEFRKLEPVGPVTISKYTSPLDYKISSSNQINPMEILCPFEINGTCRDKECSFNHCSKKV